MPDEQRNKRRGRPKSAQPSKERKTASAEEKLKAEWSEQQIASIRKKFKESPTEEQQDGMIDFIQAEKPHLKDWVIRSLFGIGDNRLTRVKQHKIKYQLQRSAEFKPPNRVQSSELTIVDEVIQNVPVETGFPCSHRPMREYALKHRYATEIYDEYLNKHAQANTQSKPVAYITFKRRIKVLRPQFRFKKTRTDLCHRCYCYDIAIFTAKTEKERTKFIHSKCLHLKQALLQRVVMNAVIRHAMEAANVPNPPSTMFLPESMEEMESEGEEEQNPQCATDAQADSTDADSRSLNLQPVQIFRPTRFKDIKQTIEGLARTLPTQTTTLPTPMTERPSVPSAADTNQPQTQLISQTLTAEQLPQLTDIEKTLKETMRIPLDHTHISWTIETITGPAYKKNSLTEIPEESVAVFIPLTNELRLNNPEGEIQIAAHHAQAVVQGYTTCETLRRVQWLQCTFRKITQQPRNCVQTRGLPLPAQQNLMTTLNLNVVSKSTPTDEILPLLWFHNIKATAKSKTVTPTYKTNLIQILSQDFILLGTRGDGNCGVYTALFLSLLAGGPSWGFNNNALGRCQPQVSKSIRDNIFKDELNRHPWLHIYEVKELARRLHPDNECPCGIIDIENDRIQLSYEFNKEPQFPVYIMSGADHFFLGFPPASPFRVLLGHEVLQPTPVSSSSSCFSSSSSSSSSSSTAGQDYAHLPSHACIPSNECNTSTATGTEDLEEDYSSCTFSCTFSSTTDEILTSSSITPSPESTATSSFPPAFPPPPPPSTPSPPEDLSQQQQDVIPPTDASTSLTSVATPPPQTQESEHYLCPVCEKICTTGSISCDGCDNWTHFHCAGLTQEQADRKRKFLCCMCSGSKGPAGTSTTQLCQPAESSSPQTSSDTQTSSTTSQGSTTAPTTRPAPKTKKTKKKSIKSPKCMTCDQDVLPVNAVYICTNCQGLTHDNCTDKAPEENKEWLCAVCTSAAVAASSSPTAPPPNLSFRLNCLSPMVLTEDATGSLQMPWRKGFSPSIDYFNPKLSLTLEIIALPILRTAFLFMLDPRLCTKNGDAMCSIRWEFFREYIKSFGLNFDAVIRIRDNLVSENKSKKVMLYDIFLSVLLKLKGGITVFLLPGHSHFYPDGIGADIKRQLNNMVLYTSNGIVSQVAKARRVQFCKEMVEIFDWSALVDEIELDNNFPTGFTKNYFFAWQLPDTEDGPLVVQMAKFGGTPATDILLSNSVARLRTALCQILFGVPDIPPRDIFTSSLLMPRRPPNGMTEKKLDEVRNLFSSIPIDHHWWYTKYSTAPMTASTSPGQSVTAGTVPLGGINEQVLRAAIHNELGAVAKNISFFDRMDQHVSQYSSQSQERLKKSKRTELP